MKWNDLPEELRGAINRYVRMSVAESWSGSAEKEERPIIKKRLKAAKQHLTDVLQKKFEIIASENSPEYGAFSHWKEDF